MTLGLSAPEGRPVGKAEARRLRQFLGRQKKETMPVVRDMRRGALRAGGLRRRLTPSD